MIMLPRMDGRKIKVKDSPQFTDYFWGDISDIIRKHLTLIERNQQGDCLCFLEGKGLVDVDHRDIA